MRRLWRASINSSLKQMKKTPSDDPRLIELDMLSALVEEYEKEVCPIQL